jgi:hypothetical protein
VCGSPDVSLKKKLSPKKLIQKAFSFGRSPLDPENVSQRLEQEQQRQDSEMKRRGEVSKEAAAILLGEERHKVTRAEPVPS